MFYVRISKFISPNPQTIGCQPANSKGHRGNPACTTINIWVDWYGSMSRGYGYYTALILHSLDSFGSLHCDASLQAFVKVSSCLVCLGHGMRFHVDCEVPCASSLHGRYTLNSRIILQHVSIHLQDFVKHSKICAFQRARMNPDLRASLGECIVRALCRLGARS